MLGSIGLPPDPYDPAVVQGWCCKCYPARICVTLTFPDGCACEGDEGTIYDRTYSAHCELDCENNDYSGAFACGGTGDAADAIDFRLYFLQDNADGYKCWLAFESEALGLTGPDLLKTPLGGVYQDAEEKRLECEAFTFSFELDLSAAFPGCGTGTVSVAPGDYVEVKQCCPENCIYPRMCVTLDDGYTAQTVLACTDGSDYAPQYSAVLDSPFGPGSITVYIQVTNYSDVLDNGATPLLQITAPAEFGDPVGDNPAEAACPQMGASWDFYAGYTITAKGDPRALCADCRCICRELCVIKILDPLEAIQNRILAGVAVWDESYSCPAGLGGWVVELTDEYGNIHREEFTLSCDACTGVTYFIYSRDPDNPREIACPDLGDPNVPAVTGYEFLITDPDTEFTSQVRVSCVACVPCQAQNVQTQCCPSPIPTTLTLEVVDDILDCACLLGLTCTLTWTGDETDFEWTGVMRSTDCPASNDPITWTLRCIDADNWELTGCGGAWTLESSSCDPLELDFVGGGGCPNCNEPATSQFRVRITA